MLSITSFFVGMRRFELPTSSTPCWRDTGLRYIPKRATNILNVPPMQNDILKLKLLFYQVGGQLVY